MEDGDASQRGAKEHELDRIMPELYVHADIGPTPRWAGIIPLVSIILGSTRLLASGRLRGQRVGVVANPASVDGEFTHIVDALMDAQRRDRSPRSSDRSMASARTCRTT